MGCELWLANVLFYPCTASPDFILMLKRMVSRMLLLCQVPCGDVYEMEVDLVRGGKTSFK